MSLAVVISDSKGIQSQKLCTNYPSWNVILFLHCCPFCMRRTWWDGDEEEVWRDRER